MIINCGVTLYHYDEDKELYRHIYFPQVHLKYVSAASAGKGMDNADKSVVRIYTAADIPLAAGDKLVVGRTNSDTPPAGRYATVTAYKDNRYSISRPHWRLELR